MDRALKDAGRKLGSMDNNIENAVMTREPQRPMASDNAQTMAPLSATERY